MPGGGILTTITCQQCKQEFEAFLYLVKKGKKKFCSRECANLAKIIKLDPKYCKFCDKQFIPTAKHKEKIFCSKKMFSNIYRK